MDIQTVFKRYEIKYFLTQTQMQELKQQMEPYMCADAHGKSTILNLYFDTPNDMLIRHSLEKPVYKEKLRLRSYQIPHADTPVFLEIKKKYEGVVYKRRIGSSYRQMTDYLEHGIPFSDSQIMHEINYFMSYYPELTPHVFLSYDREAFYGKTDADFRITFDRNILWRTDQLTLDAGVFGTPLLPENAVLLEIKTAGGMPLWLTHFLRNEQLQKCSFSKYGTVYIQTLKNHSQPLFTDMEVAI